MMLPQTGKGVLVVVGVVLALLVWNYTAMLLSAAIGIVLIALGLYLLYVVLYRINEYFKHGSVRPGRSFK